ncbi:phytanoyl-CoA dioxygenase family protein [Mariniblastus fucicola]|uniref:Kanamycin B dioxygenase n=1 Tax=Mariniblastus fucicola TaxID=980251 RepID=A0A5B9P6A3_9BACT|nr:phytanoyl-CoA dioxygenase family protein [Mariniblastus fucicola]QEG22117.1 Kanamycin B dioxygenase [Mariniblastus fucicola]
MNSQINVSDSDPDQSDQAAKLFREHGTLFLQNAFPRSLIQSVADAFAEKYLSMSKKELRKRDAVVGDRRYMVTVDIKKPFNRPELYANPQLMPILERLLSPHLRIASFGAVVAWPGAESQPVHLDHPPLFDPAEQNQLLPPYAVTLVVPLVDVTPEIGPTAIWPGSHSDPNRLQQLSQLMEAADYSDAEMPVTKLGDAYMMDYRVIHGGMANNSDTVRPILYLVYSRPWFRDGFNFSSQPSVQIGKKQRKKVPDRWQGLFRK